MLRISFLLFAACLTNPSFAETFNYPGGIVNLQLRKESNELPTVKYGLKEPTIIEQKKSWQVLIGIGLDTLPGEYLVYVKSAANDTNAYSETFQIQQTPSAVLLDIAQNSVVKKPFSLTHKNVNDLDYSNTQQPSLPLSYPTNGEWVDYFGYSVINKKNRADLQNYISITTTELKPVQAPQNAIISRIEPYFGVAKQQDPTLEPMFTLFLDHGRGLYSIISGVSNLSIETGNGVVAGAVLGMLPISNVDKDIRPNQLIWQTMLNGVYVNPTILTKIQ